MRILFIGNSHTYYNDMPALFQEICRKHGIDAHVVMLTKGGMGLDYHAQQEQTLFNIRYGGYDYVVLQHNAHPLRELEGMREATCELVKLIREAGGTPILYQTWARKGDEAFQPIMSAVYNALGKELDIPVAPVGDEWQKMQTAHPEVNLFWTDGQHASPEGSRLAARVIFETIFPEQKE